MKFLLNRTNGTCWADVDEHVITTEEICNFENFEGIRV